MNHNFKDKISLITRKTLLPEHQAWWLIEFVTSKTRSNLMANQYQLTQTESANLTQLIHEIAVNHKPLAYILDWVPFLELELLVQPPTLIPRPETEEWVEALINKIKTNQTTNLTFLDIGTGSGCIALSLAQAFPSSQIYAVDICPQALALAQKNAKKNNLKNITFIQSDLFTNIPTDVKFDLIVSNPPYIDPAAQLDNSVLAWEDHGALFAKNRGMQIIEQIAIQAPKYLKKNNELEYQLVMEIDVSQGTITQTLLQDCKFTNIVIRKDQFDRDRTVWASQV